MYHIAGKFASKADSQAPYETIERAMRTHQFRAHLTRLQLPDGYYISVTHPDNRAVTPAIEELLKKELGQGQITRLPDDVLSAVIERSRQRRASGTSEFTSHTPTRVSYKTPVLQDSETGEIIQSFPQATQITGETELTDAQARAQLAEQGISPDLYESIRRVMEKQGKESFIAKDAPEDIQATQRELIDLISKIEIGKGSGISFDTTAKFPGGLPVPARISTIPFIIGYRDLQARGVAQVPGKYDIEESARTDAVQIAMNTIMDRKLRRADKYQFDQSAWAMLETVRDPAAQEWISLKNNLWIEFKQPVSSEHGKDIKALWLHAMDMQADIRDVAPPARDPRIFSAMSERNSLYRGYWSFNVIDMRAREIFDFTYDLAQGRFIYLYSHVCPYDQCEYIHPETLTTLGECSPCLQCQAALAHWASVLHTAIRIIRREYALAPQESAPWAEQAESYEVDARVKVGKGKNSRLIKKTEKHTVDYRLVRFEVSELGYPARQLADETIAQVEQDAQKKGKRANWLKLAQEAGEPGAIIWEYRDIDTSRGRTLDPAHNPRWKSYKHVEVKPFKQWVPMLSRERKTIKKVTARRYNQES